MDGNAACTSPCSGDSSQHCGGPTTNTIYFVDALNGSQLHIKYAIDKSSAVAEMGDRLATTDMGRKLGAVAL